MSHHSQSLSPRDDLSIPSPEQIQATRAAADLDAPSEVKITLGEFKYEIERQRDIYEDEIIALNEELAYIKDQGSRIIQDKIEPYRRENEYLRSKLIEAGLAEPDSSAEKSMSNSEKKALAEYYDQLRKVHERQNSQFKSPNVIGMDQYWDYEEEHQTASANYRPGNSDTCLRKPRAVIASGQPYTAKKSRQS